MSQTRILCEKCGFQQVYCKCGTAPKAFDYMKTSWKALMAVIPYGWCIVATAQQCKHRKDTHCLSPSVTEGRLCAREGCPMLPENFKELFHG